MTNVLTYYCVGGTGFNKPGGAMITSNVLCEPGRFNARVRVCGFGYCANRAVFVGLGQIETEFTSSLELTHDQLILVISRPS